MKYCIFLIKIFYSFKNFLNESIIIFINFNHLKYTLTHINIFTVYSISSDVRQKILMTQLSGLKGGGPHG